MKSLLFLFSLIHSRRFLTMTDSALLLCQKNAYIKESVNKVLYCQPLKDSSNFRVVLDDSVLYAEGGGQPYDLGTVNGIPVMKVLKNSVEIPELPSEALTTSVEMELSNPVEVGSLVKCEVDWTRRYDFMQQHTAQHLFSAIADILYKADTVGWALGSDSVTVDLSSTPPLTPEQIQHIEDETNARIRTGAKVDWKVFSKEELQTELACEPKRGDFVHMRGEVKGAALDMSALRLVSIDGIDLNPCGGTHLQSLAEINLFKVIGLEKDRNNLRVRFVAGQRALTYFQACLQREAAINTKLSINSAEQVNTIDKFMKEKRDLVKRYDVYSEELAMLLGESWLQKAATTSTVPVIVQHRTGADLKFLIKLATTMIEKQPNAILLVSGDEGLPISVSASSKATEVNKKKEKKNPSSSNNTASAVASVNEGPFVLFGEPKVIDQVKEIVLSTLGGRGGGRPGRLQGQATQLQSLETLIPILQEVANKSYCNEEGK